MRATVYLCLSCAARHHYPFFQFRHPCLGHLLATYAILAVLLIFIVLAGKGKIGKIVFNLYIIYTVVMILVIFNSLGGLIAGMQREKLDAYLIRSIICFSEPTRLYGWSALSVPSLPLSCSSPI